MKSKQLLTAVIAEATNLLRHATQLERDRLDINELRADNAFTCIYGLMFGYCASKRAVYMLNLCARPYTSTLHGEPEEPEGNNFSGRIGRKGMLSDGVFSAIEYYITLTGANNKDLIAYIKGSINLDELVL